MSEPIESLIQAIGSVLQAMHEEATTLRGSHRTGLTDYAFHAGGMSRRYEVPVYHRMAELLREKGWSVECDVPYPSAGRFCDMVVRRGSSFCCPAEVKLVWREWFSTITGSIKRWTEDSYIRGARRGGRERDHSLAQDFDKVEDFGPGATHQAVIALAFDAAGSSLDQVIRVMESEQHLEEGGWKRGPVLRLDDWNSPTHQISIHVWTRVADGAHARPSAETSLPVNPNVDELLGDVSKFEARATTALRKYTRLGSDQWWWENLVAEVLELPESHGMVAQAGARLRESEPRYRAENYASRNDTERFSMSLLQICRRIRREALAGGEPGK